MKNSKVIKEERAEVIEKMESLVASAEGRDLTSDETVEFDSLNEKVEELNSMAIRSEKFEALKAANAVKEERTNTPKEVESFSFQEAMRQAVSGKIEGLYKEMDQEARNEARLTGQNFKGLAIPSMILEARTAAETAAVNGVEVMSFTDQLEGNLVLASAGANFYSSVNSMKFPVVSGVNSYFVPESGGSAGTPTGTATSLTLSPKKIISVVNVSNEAMAQNSSLEAALRRNMAQNIAATIESALLDTADVTNAPASIFADAAATSVGVTAADFLDLETSIIDAGVQMQGARMAYLLDATAYAAVKALAQVSNVSAIWDNATKELNGYFGFVSPNVALNGASGKAHALFGDFSKVHIAQFGGLDFLYDPYTGGATGEPRLIVTSLIDGDAVQNADAFANLIEA
jgi:HK97 family phage major capsid protein